MADWWATRSPNSHLVLVSRSGHTSAPIKASSQLHALFMGSSLVTVTRCDIGSRTETASLGLATSRATDSPVTVCIKCLYHSVCALHLLLTVSAP